jgi:hypothetical protein
MPKIESLPANQRRAIRALMTKPTIEAAAKFATVSESSLYRWLAEDTFRAALLEAEGDALDGAARRLVALSEAAIAVITQILVDRDAPALVRLRAAETVLSNMLRLTELRNIESRVSALEGKQ